MKALVYAGAGYLTAVAIALGWVSAVVHRAAQAGGRL